ncbi:hypothetical protein [Mycolicibacterium sphagni]|uniref:Transmembrane protein n=1 Tax=Mycolicibacterium sphagni TaxID=1786 RepID=A0A255D5P2_9MYCO|nr:hypothetical protein [Mycolicibacterium sphagni]OYN74454.1 hypothetical protein CG716_28565 [Mycolicibacterium sphagni]
MQTFTLATSSWVKRLVTRNPLIRASDRLEAAALLALLMLALLIIPVVGAVGTAVYDSRTHAIAGRRHQMQQVEGVASHDTTIGKLPYQQAFLTPLTWQYEGRTHADVLVTAEDMKTGDHTMIWVDGKGAPAASLPSGDDALTEALVVTLGLCAAVAGACIGAWELLRLRLQKRRYDTWDRELRDLAGGRRNHNT